jgi:hypothetical protein
MSDEQKKALIAGAARAAALAALNGLDAAARAAGLAAANKAYAAALGTTDRSNRDATLDAAPSAPDELDVADRNGPDAANLDADAPTAPVGLDATEREADKVKTTREDIKKAERLKLLAALENARAKAHAAGIARAEAARAYDAGKAHDAGKARDDAAKVFADAMKNLEDAKNAYAAATKRET